MKSIITGIVLISLLGGAFAQPVPGDVFREYAWAMPGNGQSESFLRVCGDGDYHEPTSDEWNFFPEGFVDKGWLTLPQELDLEDAIRAEVVVERMLCHDGTTGLAVKFNEGNWYNLPDADSIPQPQSEYLYHYYPIVQIPLSELKSGPDSNHFRFTLNPGQRFGMPQNMVYGMVLRIYYKDSKPHCKAEISSISRGDKLGAETILKVKARGKFSKVDYLGLMDNLNYEGDGVYYQWHYNYHRGELVNHIGSTETGDFTWNTEWIPDQTKPMQIAARVRDESGIIYMTQAIEDLRFERDFQVELCKPYNIPRRWATRESEFVAGFDVKGDLSKAESFLVSAVTWSPGYLNGVYINDFLIMDREACKYCYHIIRREYNETAFLSTMNSVKTGKTPLYNGKMVHGTEIQYPGFMVLVRYKAE